MARTLTQGGGGDKMHEALRFSANPPRKGSAAGDGMRGDQIALSIICAIWFLPTAPTWVACTWPSLMSNRVGMPRTP